MKTKDEIKDRMSATIAFLSLFLIFAAIIVTYSQAFKDGKEQLCKELKFYPYDIDGKFHCLKEKLVK